MTVRELLSPEVPTQEKIGRLGAAALAAAAGIYEVVDWALVTHQPSTLLAAGVSFGAIPIALGPGEHLEK